MTDNELIDNCKILFKEEGYEIKDILFSDYGKTIKAVVSKGGEDHLLPIKEIFYDGKNYYGETNIATTSFYKERFP